MEQVSDNKRKSLRNFGDNSEEHVDIDEGLSGPLKGLLFETSSSARTAGNRSGTLMEHSRSDANGGQHLQRGYFGSATSSGTPGGQPRGAWTNPQPRTRVTAPLPGNSSKGVSNA